MGSRNRDSLVKMLGAMAGGGMLGGGKASADRRCRRNGVGKTECSRGKRGWSWYFLLLTSALVWEEGILAVHVSGRRLARVDL